MALETSLGTGGGCDGGGGWEGGGGCDSGCPSPAATASTLVLAPTPWPWAPASWPLAAAFSADGLGASAEVVGTRGAGGWGARTGVSSSPSSWYSRHPCVHGHRFRYTWREHRGFMWYMVTLIPSVLCGNRHQQLEDAVPQEPHVHLTPTKPMGTRPIRSCCINSSVQTPN